MPIDACYELVGQLRTLWRGFDGGQEARDALDAFFDGVRAQGAMSDLAFEVLDARAEPYAAVPTIMFRLRITERGAAPVHAVALALPDPDRAAAASLQPRRGGAARRGVRRARRSGATPCGRSCGRTSPRPITGFDGSTEVDLPVTCTYDFEVAGTKYFHALDDGEIPLVLLFSGTTFVAGDAGFSVGAGGVARGGVVPAARCRCGGR